MALTLIIYCEKGKKLKLTDQEKLKNTDFVASLLFF